MWYKRLLAVYRPQHLVSRERERDRPHHIIKSSKDSGIADTSMAIQEGSQELRYLFIYSAFKGPTTRDKQEDNHDCQDCYIE